MRTRKPLPSVVFCTRCGRVVRRLFLVGHISGGDLSECKKTQRAARALVLAEERAAREQVQGAAISRH